MPPKVIKKPEFTGKRFYVHQIFGLLGDTELPPLFRDNQFITKKWCIDNNYTYRFWDTKSCDNLIKKYPEFEELYYSVKYPIMRVDIIRFIILHYYGGLYIDMDCRPNIDSVNTEIFAAAFKEGRKKHFEIEVLQSNPCNHILIKFLNYVIKQIEEKDKIEIYDTWKARYVYQTTGPYSFNRFIKKESANIHKYIINEPLTFDKSLNLNGNEDFISHYSCSYIR